MNTDIDTLISQEIIYHEQQDYTTRYKVKTRRGLIRALKRVNKVGFGWNLAPTTVCVYDASTNVNHEIIFSDPFFYPDLYKRYGERCKREKDRVGDWQCEFIREILDAMDK